MLRHENRSIFNPLFFGRLTDLCLGFFCLFACFFCRRPACRANLIFHKALVCRGELQKDPPHHTPQTPSTFGVLGRFLVVLSPQSLLFEAQCDLPTYLTSTHLKVPQRHEPTQLWVGHPDLQERCEVSSQNVDFTFMCKPLCACPKLSVSPLYLHSLIDDR